MHKRDIDWFLFLYGLHKSITVTMLTLIWMELIYTFPSLWGHLLVPLVLLKNADGIFFKFGVTCSCSLHMKQMLQNGIITLHCGFSYIPVKDSLCSLYQFLYIAILLDIFIVAHCSLYVSYMIIQIFHLEQLYIDFHDFYWDAFQWLSFTFS